MKPKNLLFHTRARRILCKWINRRIEQMIEEYNDLGLEPEESELLQQGEKHCYMVLHNKILSLPSPRRMASFILCEWDCLEKLLCTSQAAAEEIRPLNIEAQKILEA